MFAWFIRRQRAEAWISMLLALAIDRVVTPPNGVRVEVVGEGAVEPIDQLSSALNDGP